MSSFRPVSTASAILVMGCVAVGAAGCGGGLSKINPFKKEEARLKGERVPVFSENHVYGPQPEFVKRHEEVTGSDCFSEGEKCPPKQQQNQ